MRVFTELKEISGFCRAVVTIGSFDGVHSGHRGILEKVKALATSCQGESVVVTFDPHPRAVLRPADTGFKLITSTAEKIQLLAACGVDNVVIVPFTPEFSEQSAAQYVEDFLIHFFHPRYIVIGYDHRFGNNREGDINFLKKYEQAAGFEVVEIAAQEIDDIAVSSSKIRFALDHADIILANKLLGAPFCLSGKVVEGNKIGRSIGFPTANLLLEDPYKLVLPAGIYAAWATVNLGNGLENTKAKHPAMLYVGNRPTVSQNGQKVIEVNLIGFEGDLYGTVLQVEVIDYIRPDKKLEGLEALKMQIEADKREISRRLEATDVKTITIPFPSPDIQVSKNGQRVAIVILNYNTRKHLETYLPSVMAHSAGARIIVADNGSPDDSIAWLKANHPSVELIDLQQNHGFAQGYNEALKQVDADIYVILNSDVEVTQGWMDPVLDAMWQDSAIGIAQPKILAWRDKQKAANDGLTAENKTVRFEYAGAAGGWIDVLGYPFCRGRIFSHSEPDLGQYDAPQSCFWAAGAAFFIRAELYHTFGGFDGDYFAHNEEIDLCWRIKRAGYTVWCFPASIVYHLGGGTLEYENPRKVFLNFRNSLYSLLKNESFGKLLWLIPARFLLDGLAALRFAAKGQFKAIWAIAQAHWSFYTHFGKTLHKRREASRIIEKYRIAPENKEGIYSKSIIVSHYLRRIKVFSKLISHRH